MNRLRSLLLLTALVLLPARARADTPCSGAGTTVITDPSGDVASPHHDVVAVKMADVFGGTFAGKFMVTLDLATTDPPGPDVAGLWIVSWDQPGGDTTMTLTVQRCEGAFNAGYTYQSGDAQYSQSGPVDDFRYEDGHMQFVLSRDKFGNLPPGSTLSAIRASTITMEIVPPLGCLPSFTSPEATDTSSYTMGSCTVAVPVRSAEFPFRLGPVLPNPARGAVHLSIELPAAVTGRPLEVSVFDPAGRRVRSLASGAAVSGSHVVEWDLRTDAGRRVAAGSYWIRVRVGGSSVARALTVTR